MPVYIEKSGDLFGCYHSRTNKRANKQGTVELLSHWAMEGHDEQYERYAEEPYFVHKVSYLGKFLFQKS